ncbi:endonuclease [Niallia endozanthoxylica]|uniref:Endonuclease n=2 Tax=Niallia endozanthoxylica TaxID=2036016 RepID=A0A5J5HR97_9BACI|nr:endonuclease [Niallia endozanthoxylica]
MTWNLYLGADLSPLFSATILEEVPRRVTEVYRQFLATNIGERVKKIAQQIALLKPDFIGLQEAALWQLRQLMVPDVPHVTFDYVDLLLRELQKKGLSYEVAACNKNFSAQLRSSQGNFVRLSDRDLILIRKDSQLKVVKRQEANFKTNLITKLGGQRVELLRGWSSIDVSHADHLFRVITTHLEPASTLINLHQGYELLDGPAKTNLPIILLGDVNINKEMALPPTTYGNFLHEGFQDVWNEVGQGPGLTCCQDSDLLNAFSTLNRRIDCILYKNGWKPISAKIIGAEQTDRTSNALWTSDHAGVIANLEA